MSGVKAEAHTRYSVRRSRSEIRKERRRRYTLWALVVAAFVVIVVFAALILVGAGA
jgi:t-SNARE complex subunit (syntaxin)